MKKLTRTRLLLMFLAIIPICAVMLAFCNNVDSPTPTVVEAATDYNSINNNKYTFSATFKIGTNRDRGVKLTLYGKNSLTDLNYTTIGTASSDISSDWKTLEIQCDPSKLLKYTYLGFEGTGGNFSRTVYLTMKVSGPSGVNNQLTLLDGYEGFNDGEQYWTAAPKAVASFNDNRYLAGIATSTAPQDFTLGPNETKTLTNIVTYDQYHVKYDAGVTLSVDAPGMSISGNTLVANGSAIALNGSSTEITAKKGSSEVSTGAYSCYRQQYNVTVNSKTPSYGTTPTGKTGSYRWGDQIALTATPAFGYNFSKWYVNNVANSTSASTTFTVPQANVTYTSEFVPKTSVINFNLAGGTGGTSSTTLSYGIVPNAITPPTHYGYDFGGYYDGTNGSGNCYFNSSGTGVKAWDKIDTPFTMYAKWTPKVMTATFNANGGNLNGSSTLSVTYLQRYDKSGAFPTATRYGYTFAGWYDAASGGNQILPSTVVEINSNTTLFARWNSLSTYKYTFELDGGTGSSTPPDITQYDTYSVTLPENTAFQKAGFTAIGWIADGIIYDFGESVTVSKSLNFKVNWLSSNISIIKEGISREYINPTAIDFTFLVSSENKSLWDISLAVTADGVAADGTLNYNSDTGAVHFNTGAHSNSKVEYLFTLTVKQSGATIFATNVRAIAYYMSSLSVKYNDTTLSNSLNIDAFAEMNPSSINNLDDYNRYMINQFDTRYLTISGSPFMSDEYTLISGNPSVLTATDMGNNQIKLKLIGNGTTTLDIKHKATNVTKTLNITVATVADKLFVLAPSYVTADNLIASMNGLSPITPAPSAVTLSLSGVNCGYNVRKLSDTMFLVYSNDGTPITSGNLDFKYTLGEEIHTSTEISNLSSYKDGSFKSNMVALNTSLNFNAKVSFAEAGGRVSVSAYLYINGDLSWSDTKIITNTGRTETVNFVYGDGINSYANNGTLRSIRVMYEICGKDNIKEYMPELVTTTIYSTGMRKIKTEYTTTIEKLDLDTTVSVTQVVDGEEVTPEGKIFITEEKPQTLRIKYFTEDATYNVYAYIGSKKYTLSKESLTLPGSHSLSFAWFSGDFEIDESVLSPGEQYYLRLDVVNSAGKLVLSETKKTFSVVNAVGIPEYVGMNAMNFLGNILGGSVQDDTAGSVSVEMSLPSILPVTVQNYMVTPISGTFCMIIGKSINLAENQFEREYNKAVNQQKKRKKTVSRSMSFDLAISGYAFGTYDYYDGKWHMTFAGGGVAVLASISWSYQQTIIIGFVPVYYGIEVGIDLSIDVLLAGKNSYHDLFDIGDLDYDFVSDVIMAVEGRVIASAGVGFDFAIIALKLGVEGEIRLGYTHRFVNFLKDGEEVAKMNGGEFTVYAALRAVFEARILAWETRIVLGEASWTNSWGNGYWDSFPDGRPNGAAMNNSAGISEALASTMAFIKNDSLSSGELKWTDQLFPYTNVEIAEDGNSYGLIHYVDDINDVTEFAPAYSVYEDGEFSEAVMLSDWNTTSDNSLVVNNVVYNANGNFGVMAFDAAQNSDSVVTAQDAILQYNTSVVFGAIIRDGSYVSTKISPEGAMASNPKLYMLNGKAIVVWQSATYSVVEGALSVSDTSLWYSIYDGSAWSAAEELYDGSTYDVTAYEVVMDSDMNFAVIATAIPSGLSGDTAKEIILLTKNVYGKDIVRLTNNDLYDSYAKIEMRTNNDEEVFLLGYFTVLVSTKLLENGVMQNEFEYETHFLTVNKFGDIIDGLSYTVEDAYVASNFEFARNTDKSLNGTVVTWIDYTDNEKGDLYSAVIEVLPDGTMALSNSFKMEGYYDITFLEVSSVVTANGVLAIATHQDSPVDETAPKYAARLSVSDCELNKSLDEIDFMLVPSEATSGNLPIELTVKNTTYRSIKGVRIVTASGNTDLSLNLASGNTGYVDYNYVINNTVTSIAMDIYPIYTDNSIGEKKTYVVATQLPDIALNADGYTIEKLADGYRKLTVDITNIGADLVTNKVLLYLANNNERITDISTSSDGATINDGYITISGTSALDDINNGVYTLVFTFKMGTYNDDGIATYDLTAETYNSVNSEVTDSNYLNNHYCFSEVQAVRLMSASEQFTHNLYVHSVSSNTTVKVDNNFETAGMVSVNISANGVAIYNEKIFLSGNSSREINIDGTDALTITLTPVKLYAHVFKLNGEALPSDYSITDSDASTVYISGVYYFIEGEHTITLTKTNSLTSVTKSITVNSTTPIVNEVDLATAIVTWKINGKTFESLYAIGAMPSYSGNVNKDGDETCYYNFAGYNPSIAEVASNVTYTAVYEQIFKSYTVTFDRQGALVGTESVSATYGSIMPSITMPTKQGYDFGGYYTGINGSGTKYYTQSGSDVASDLTENTTLYALWTAQTYSVTFNAVSGEPVTDSITVTYDSTYPTLSQTTRTGYTFVGWYLDIEYSVQVTNTTRVTALNDHVLFAKWQANNYKVTFDYNGATGNNTQVDASVYYDCVYTLSVPSKQGYTFIGWYNAETNNNGSGRLIATNLGSSIHAYSVVGDMTVYAGWSLNAPTISTQPISISSVYDGSDKFLTVTVAYAMIDNINYQWWVNYGSGFVAISGATSSTLAVSDVDDSGNYYCVATSTVPAVSHSVTSSTVNVSITKATYDMSGASWAYTSPFTYDGTAKAITVNGLPSGVTVATYANNSKTDAGTYTASATLSYDTANYNAPSIANCEWTINKAAQTITVNNVEVIYDGNAHSITGATASGNGEISYSANNTLTNVGSAIVTVTAATNANYLAATATATITITKATYDMSGASWAYTAPFTYDGTAKAITVNGLPSGVTVATYANNSKTDAGTYTANATLSYDTTNYNAPNIANCEWTINKAAQTITVNNVEVIFDGNAYSITGATASGNGEISYSANNTLTNVGSVIVTVTAATNTNYLAATATATITITKATYDMSGASWAYTSPFTYDGTAKTVVLSGLPNGVTANYTNNSKTDAGTYTASATLSYDTTNYNAPSSIANCEWTINKAAQTITVNNVEVIYDGNAHSITGATASGNGEISYSANNTLTNVGSVIVTVTAATNTNYLAATTTATITITKATYDMSGASWAYTAPFTYDGTAKAITVNGLPLGVTVATYVNNSKTDAGTYTASATLSYDTTNYNAPSIANCEWTINKAAQTITVNNIEAIYDGNAHSITGATASGNGEISYSANNTLTNVGSAIVTVTAATNTNYLAATATATITITKATYDMSGASWAYTSPFTYDGTAKAITVNGLPSGVTVATYANNSKTDAGTYTASATLSYDTTNYNAPSIANCEWTINKTAQTITVNNVEVIYDGNAHSITGATASGNGEISYSANNTLTNVGSVIVTVTAATNTNYLAASTTATITITKATYDMSGASWAYTSPFTYDGTAKAITVNGLPSGVTVATYANNSKTDAGTYTANATLSYDTTNYNAPSIANCEWTINKAAVIEPTLANTIKVYNKTEQTLVIAESALYSISGNKQTNVGEYKAKLTLTDSANYYWNESGNIDDVVYDWSITPLQIIVSNENIACIKVYDGTTSATVVAFNTNILDDTVSITITADFNSKNVRDASSISVIYTLNGDTLGNYIKPADYTISENVSITPKTITIDGVKAVDRQYDGTVDIVLDISDASLIGTITNDDVTFSGESGTIVDDNAAETPYNVETVLTISGDDVTNYTLTAPNYVTVTISKRKLTVEDIIATNKIYDKTAVIVLSGGTLSGIIGSEDVQFTLGDGCAESALAGIRSVTTSITIHGVDVDNYYIEQPDYITVDIATPTIIYFDECKTIIGNKTGYSSLICLTMLLGIALFVKSKKEN